MADPHWTSYVGMATGLAGALMGYVSFRRSNALKSLDLRLELRKAINAYLLSLSQLEELVELANKSRERVLSAIGKSSSGDMAQWKSNYEKDKDNLSQLIINAPKPDLSYDKSSPNELESKLITIHKTQGEANVLMDKYQSALNSDDESRKQIREDIRVQYAPRN